MRKDNSKLKRPIQQMPDYIKRALIESGLKKAYEERPPYQRNDYLSWISRAKLDETKQKQLNRCLRS